MSSWQQDALEMWPEYAEDIQEMEEPHQLWFTLWSEFITVTHETHDETFLRRVYAYALWSLDQSQDVFEAAILYFYEDLPNDARVKAEMHRYLSIDHFDSIVEIWRYGRSEAEYTALIDELRNIRRGKAPPKFADKPARKRPYPR